LPVAGAPRAGEFAVMGLVQRLCCHHIVSGGAGTAVVPV